MKGFLKTAYPPGAPILPDLLRLQGLEVYEYICAIAALHLRQTRRLQDLGEIDVLPQSRVFSNHLCTVAGYKVSNLFPSLAT